jgi:hypothetical protein
MLPAKPHLLIEPTSIADQRGVRNLREWIKEKMTTTDKRFTFQRAASSKLKMPTFLIYDTSGAAFTVAPFADRAREIDVPQLIGELNAVPVLVAALRATARWQMPDGPCWCDHQRRQAGLNKLHSLACRTARDAMAEVLSK